MDYLAFLIPFFALLLAEFGDKTQIALLTLGSKYKNHYQLFFGAILAFAIIDGFAIIFGKVFFELIPQFYIGLFSGILFLIFGYFSLKGDEEEDEKVKLSKKSPFILAFSLIFLAELGDKSQIVAFLFASQYNPILVFLGVILAMGVLSALALFFGKVLMKKLDQDLIEKIAGVLFILIGLFTLGNLFF